MNWTKECDRQMEDDHMPYLNENTLDIQTQTSENHLDELEVLSSFPLCQTLQ